MHDEATPPRDANALTERAQAMANIETAHTTCLRLQKSAEGAAARRREELNSMRHQPLWNPNEVAYILGVRKVRLPETNETQTPKATMTTLPAPSGASKRLTLVLNAHREWEAALQKLTNTHESYTDAQSRLEQAVQERADAIDAALQRHWTTADIAERLNVTVYRVRHMRKQQTEARYHIETA